MIQMIRTLEDEGPITSMMHRIHAMFDRARERNYVVECTLSAGKLNAPPAHKPQRTLSEIRAGRADVLVMHDRGMSAQEIALLTGWSPKSIYGIVRVARRDRKGGR